MIATEAEAREYCFGVAGSEAVAQLDRFAELLWNENARQNLVSRGSSDEFWQRHLADSVQLLPHVSRETLPWLDLGTGAGLPGIVLAICRPQSEFVLVESRKRRVEWLRSAIEPLNLYNIRLERTKLEDVPSFAAGQICARAFAPLGKLLHLAGRFSTPDTTWLLPKGRSAAQELSEQPKRVQAMFHVEQSQTDPESKILVGRGVPPVS